jgi:5-formyltetrahydrofolate cyclo-ligase
LPDPAELVRRKAELRALLSARRRTVTAEAAALAASAVADLLAQALALPAPVTVAGYWPLADELDPRPAMQRLAAAGHGLALPRMEGRAAPLAFHAWSWGDPLLPGGFAVMQPDPGQPKLAPEVVLVPLLAFDARGHRLGYGKGYYDRTLRSLRAAGAARRTIGIAFALQEVPEVPATSFDEPLDAVVTEHGLRICAPPERIAAAGARPA